MPITRTIRFRRGQTLSAAALNAAAGAGISSITGGPGVTVRTSNRSAAIALDLAREHWIPAVITAAPDPDTPIPHGDAVYAARALGEGSIRVTGLRPHYTNAALRPGQTPAPLVYPARVGDDCHIVAVPDPDAPPGATAPRVRLAVWSEAISWCPAKTGQQQLHQPQT